MVSITEARTSEEVDEVRRLFTAYRKTPGVSVCAVGFEQEIAGLPGSYAAPDGALWVAWADGAGAGCVALRRLGDGVCEMKRLYVGPEIRGRGLGRELAAAAIRGAKQKGYRFLRLDTLPGMQEAIALYNSLGFRRIERYHDGAPEEALFFELNLRESVL